MDRIISKISMGKTTTTIFRSNIARIITITMLVVFGIIVMLEITYGTLEIGPFKFSPLLVGMIIMMIIAIISGIIFTHRTWCAHLCPIGTIITEVSGVSKYDIYKTEDCIECGKCESTCPLEDKTWKVDGQPGKDCMRCLDCVDICPKDAIELGTRSEKGNKIRTPQDFNNNNH